MPEPRPFGETSFRAIVRAIRSADPVKVRGGGCVESLLTDLTQRRADRFLAIGFWERPFLYAQLRCCVTDAVRIVLVLRRRRGILFVDFNPADDRISWHDADARTSRCWRGHQRCRQDSDERPVRRR